MTNSAQANRLYSGSPWASIGLLVSGASMINVKICLRKWGAVIRTGQSHSPPPRSQPWNPAWNALHFKGKKMQFLIPFKRQSALSARPAWRRGERWQADPGPALYFSSFIKADELHFTNSYFMEIAAYIDTELTHAIIIIMIIRALFHMWATQMHLPLLVNQAVAP